MAFVLSRTPSGLVGPAEGVSNPRRFPLSALFPAWDGECAEPGPPSAGDRPPPAAQHLRDAAPGLTTPRQAPNVARRDRLVRPRRALPRRRHLRPPPHPGGGARRDHPRPLGAVDLVR